MTTCYRPKLTVEQRRELAADYLNGMRVEDIQRKYDVGPRTVYYHLEQRMITLRTEAKRPVELLRTRCTRCGIDFDAAVTETLCIDCSEVPDA